MPTFCQDHAHFAYSKLLGKSSLVIASNENINCKSSRVYIEAIYSQQDDHVKSYQRCMGGGRELHIE